MFANYFFKTRINTVFSLFFWWIKKSVYIWILKLTNNIMYKFKLSEIKNAVKELGFMFTDNDTLRDRIEMALCDLKDFSRVSRNSENMSCDRCDVMVSVEEDYDLVYTKTYGDGYHEPITETHYCRCGHELSDDITFNQYINYTFN